MSLHQACFLGIDIGTSSTKVLAVTRDGNVLAAGSAAHRLCSPAPGRFEQEPADWWKSLCQAVATALAALPGGAAAVAGIGLSGQMSSLVVLGPDNLPLLPASTVTDTRAADEAALLAARFGPRFERLAGGRPVASDVASKLLWLKSHEPEVYARMSTFVFAKDYIRFLLTGELATEPTDAGNTYFLDLTTRAWDARLFEDMGHNPGILPALVGTTQLVGSVTDEAADATGLLAGTPIVAGAADMAASVVGAAVIDPGVVAVTIGTSAQVTAPVTTLLPAADGRVDFHPHACEGLLYLLGSIFSGGLTMQWLAKAFGEEADLERGGAGYFDGLSQQAALSRTGAEGVLFLPFLVGSGSPEFDPSARAAFIGLSLAAGRPQLVRAAMEGVAHDVRQSLDIMVELGVPVERVHLAGGGAASEVWQEIIAGVLGRPVFPTRVRDASALGAAALAAVGMKALPAVREASRAMVHFRAAVVPEQSAADRYAGDHEVFLRARTLVGQIDRMRAGSSAPDPQSSGR